MPRGYPVRSRFPRARSAQAPLFTVRLLPPALGLAAALLVIKTTAPAPGRGLGLRPRARDVQGTVQPRGEAVEGEFPVARLRSRVLSDRGDARTQFRAYPGFLNIVQGGRLVNVEGRLDPGGGDIRVLTAGTGRARRSYLDLRDRQG